MDAADSSEPVDQRGGYLHASDRRDATIPQVETSPMRNSAMRHAFALWISACLFALPATGDDDFPSPERWESAVTDLERTFQDAGSPTGRILFIGSSSIRLWDLERSFPDRPTLNHGFGGCDTSDVVHFFDRLVVPTQPRAIVLYAGDNDISRGKSAERVADDFRRFVELTEERFTEPPPVYYLAVKPSLSRWTLRVPMQDANRRIQRLCESHPRLHFIDIWTPMLGDDGAPQPELFIDDGLHLNPRGYELWTAQLRPVLP